MRNRAKCKLCGSIIESIHRYDYVECKCGEIAIEGGEESYKCSAKNFGNFLRVDDQDNIIIPTIQESEVIVTNTKPAKNELIDNIKEMIKNIENLPSQAMTTAINHYDFCSLLILLVAILEAD